jgi:hypothetical protein
LPVHLRPIDRGRFGTTFDEMQSIAGYEASAEVTSFTSKFDAALAKKAQSSVQEQAGYDLFRSNAQCTSVTATAGPAKTVGHALQDVSEPGKGLDVVELCGGDEGADGCPSDAATVRAREQMVLAPERNHPSILPISGRMLKSFIAGMRFMDAVFD